MALALIDRLKELATPTLADREALISALSSKIPADEAAPLLNAILEWYDSNNASSESFGLWILGALTIALPHLLINLTLEEIELIMMFVSGELSSLASDTPRARATTFISLAEGVHNTILSLPEPDASLQSLVKDTRKAILGLVSVSKLGIDVVQAARSMVSTLVSASSVSLDVAYVNEAKQECVDALLQVISTGSTASATAAVNACSALTQQHSSALGPMISTRTCSLASSLAKEQHKMLSPSVMMMLHMYWRSVLSIATMKAQHTACKSALEATGGSATSNISVPIMPDTPPSALPRGFALEPTGSNDEASAPSTSAQSQLLKTSAGDYSLPELVSMLLTSLRESESRSSFEDMHLNGLREMQHRAALRAQTMEYERFRIQEDRGIDSVPVGRLLAHLPCSHSAMERGQRAVTRRETRLRFLRSAFIAILGNYVKLHRSLHVDDGRVLRARALLAHMFAQAPSSVADNSLDELCLQLAPSLSDPRQAAKASWLLSLVLQMLTTQFAQLAPPQSLLGASGFGLATSSSSTRSSLCLPENYAAGALHEVDIADPVAWLVQGKVGRKRLERGEDDALVLHFDLGDSSEGVVPYTRTMTRIVNILLDERSPKLDELLLAAPAITAPTWLSIHRAWCLSDDIKLVDAGMTLLRRVIAARPCYRNNALSLLLFYASCSKRAARFYSIRELRTIVLAEGKDSSVTTTIVSFAKLSLSKASQIRDVPDDAASFSKLERALARHLSLALVLCSIEGHIDLITALLETYRDCGSPPTNGGAEPTPQYLSATSPVQQALLTDKDLLPLLSSLCDPTHGTRWLKAVGEIDKCPRGAEDLAVRMLEVFAQEMRKQALKATVGNVTKSSLVKFLVALTKRCENIFQSRDDVRFLIPVIPFLPVEKVRKTVIPALLPCFSDNKLISKNLGGLLQRGFSAMVSDSGVKFEDDEPRGMKASDLLNFLHTGPSSAINCRNAVAWLIPNLRDGSTEEAPKIFGTGEFLNTLNHLKNQKPIPTLTMFTAIFVSIHDSKVQRYVNSTLLPELTKQSVWNTDPELWRGVIMFVERHWPQTFGTLTQLPQTVLIKCLQENQKLKEKFKEYSAVQQDASLRMVLSKLQ